MRPSAEPLFAAAVPAASNSMANANLLSCILLLKPLESIHVKLPTHRLPLLPASLLLSYGSPKLLNSFPLFRGEPWHIVKGMLYQDVYHSLAPKDEGFQMQNYEHQANWSSELKDANGEFLKITMLFYSAEQLSPNSSQVLLSVTWGISCSLPLPLF